MIAGVSRSFYTSSAVSGAATLPRTLIREVRDTGANHFDAHSGKLDKLGNRFRLPRLERPRLPHPREHP